MLNLRVLEGRILRLEKKIDLLIEHFGISYEPQFFDVVLEREGKKRLSLIKIVKELRNCTLMEAKEICSSPPSIIVANQESRKAADTVLKRLEMTGAVVKVVPYC